VNFLFLNKGFGRKATLQSFQHPKPNRLSFLVLLVVKAILQTILVLKEIHILIDYLKVTFSFTTNLLLTAVTVTT